MMLVVALFRILALVATALACNGCYGPSNDAVHVRKVRRMQPEALNATSSPKAPLAWGQINFLHTTDTHAWLAGHLKEQNYGADWGDYKSFVRHMRQKAKRLGVDLLVVDTGDLHDGNGLSDAETPNGVSSNPIFEEVDYDLLTIGNHELYVMEVAALTADQFAKFYGERYISSNVQIYNNATQRYENFANQYRYFKTHFGLRVMAFGVLYNFTGNSNYSKVTPAQIMVQQQWFKDAVNYPEPIDLFVVIGHNPARTSVPSSTIGVVYDAIRGARPSLPIQVFGGHNHIRDFVVYDEGATGLGSGRYCETLGWASISGIKSRSFNGTMKPRGVPHPDRPAKKPNATAPISNSTAFSKLRYSRRYLDWNRMTFAYHAVGSQSQTFDTRAGLEVSSDITETRKRLNLTALYGCAPRTWCLSCKPFGDPGNIGSLVEVALAETVVNASRADVPRMIIINSGSLRFDVVQGPFTYDDSFIVSPFANTFQFIPDVPFAIANQVLAILNSGPFQKKRSLDTEKAHGELETRDFRFTALTGDPCVDASVSQHENALRRRSEPMTRGKVRRQSDTLTLGYVTEDDFGSDGDDTIHSPIPFYPRPNDYQANASFPDDGSNPETVDLVFLDFIGADYVIPALNKAGGSYTEDDIQLYLPKEFDSNAYLPAYAQKAWQANVPNCPIGEGVGS